MWKDLSAGVVILALGFFTVRAQTDTGFQNNVTARVSAAKNSEKGDAAKRDLKIRSRDAKAYYDLGVKHGLARRYEEAVEAFKQAIRLKPDYSDAYFGLGHAYSDLGRWEEAVEAYERVVHLNPKDKEAYARLGEAYVKLRARAGGATRSVNRANASENESSEVNRTLMRPPASKAAPTLRMDSTTAAKSAPSNEVKTHYVRGLEHYRLGRYKEAVESYKQVIQLDADHPAAHYHLGMAYFKLGQDREAIRAFQQAILVSPENHAPSLKLGTLYGYYGLHKEAIEPLRRAIRLQPYSAEAHNNLGAAYYRTGQYREALEAFKQAVRLAPQVAIAHLNLSDAYQKLGLLKESAEAKRQADLLNSQGVKLLSAVWLTTLEPQSASGTSAGAGNHHDGSKAVEKEVKTVKDSSDKPEGRERESVKDGANERVETKESEAVRAANASVTPVVALNGSHAKTSASTASEATPKSTATEAPSSAPEKIEPKPDAGTAARPVSPPSLTDIYRIGVGDVLDIRLLNAPPPESTLYTVFDGGLLDYPLVGEVVEVAGLTTDEVAARLTAKIKLYDKPEVMVSVREYVSHTVLISGLVTDPGVKILRREAIPLYVLLADAQPLPEAGRAMIRSHTTGQSSVIDLSDSEALNVLIRPGDVITLEARPQQYFYIAGGVNEPGEKSFRAGMTLMQGILIAGGLSRSAGSVVEVGRQEPDGLIKMMKYKLKDIESGKVPDPPVQAGDRIIVGR